MRQEFGSERQDTLWAIFVFSLFGDQEVRTQDTGSTKDQEF